MSQTYVTFLGRGRENRETGYRTTTYQFPDGFQKKTAFFGLALAEYIEPKPDRVVILGTCGSQWGVLVENLVKTTESEEARLELLEAETQQAVTQGMLDRLADLMCEAVGVPVVPHLIPFGRNEREQYKILEIIAENVTDGAVSLDLTHGFRHFGMIGFLSAFMLQRIRNLEVSNLWYGALDMAQAGVTPVLKLDGLDRVQRWLNALSRFDATGDYGEFVELLIEDKAQCLKDAAFHERTLNLSASAQKISTFLPELDKTLVGTSGMFQKRLAERLRWVRAGRLSVQQGQLAQQYLKRRDYMRAALFGWEALVTRECEINGVDPMVRRVREQQNVSGALQSRFKGQAEVRRASENLNQIRNALAHGNNSKDKECRQMLRSETSLSQELAWAFEVLRIGRDMNANDGWSVDR
jgi:CRISPR-associated Csx2 family protein